MQGYPRGVSTEGTFLAARSPLGALVGHACSVFRRVKVLCPVKQYTSILFVPVLGDGGGHVRV